MKEQDAANSDEKEKSILWQKEEHYHSMQSELTRLRSELQYERELKKELVLIAESFYHNYPLERVRIVIEKAKLNN